MRAIAALSANIPTEMALKLLDQWHARGYTVDVVLYKKWPHSAWVDPHDEPKIAFAELPDRFPSVLSLDYRADAGHYEDEDNLYAMLLLRHLGRWALAIDEASQELRLLPSAATLPYAQATQRARSEAAEQSKNLLRRLPVGVRGAAGLTGEADAPLRLHAGASVNCERRARPLPMMRPMTTTSTLELGPVTVHFGDKSGKYPDGNQVVVRGSDTMVVFDTPQVANRIPEVLADADLAILGHVHEDHMAGLHLMPGKPVHVHQADLQAAQSFEGLSRHYGYPQPVLRQPAAQDRG